MTCRETYGIDNFSRASLLMILAQCEASLCWLRSLRIHSVETLSHKSSIGISLMSSSVVSLMYIFKFELPAKIIDEAQLDARAKISLTKNIFTVRSAISISPKLAHSAACVFG